MKNSERLSTLEEKPIVLRYYATGIPEADLQAKFLTLEHYRQTSGRDDIDAEQVEWREIRKDTK